VACEDREPEQVIKDAFSGVFEAYGVVQYLGERPVVDAARVYAYRLMQLRWEILGDGPRLGAGTAPDVAVRCETLATACSTPSARRSA
jgi:hypothetical protein